MIHRQTRTQVEDFVCGRGGGAGRLQPRDLCQDGQGHGGLAQMSPGGMPQRERAEIESLEKRHDVDVSPGFMHLETPPTTRAREARAAPTGILVD